MFTLLTAQVRADALDLFIPVTDEELATVESENAYFLKRHRYFAEQSKIVRVNDKALLEPSIRLTLFDGMVVRANRRVLEQTPLKEVIWIGAITRPAYSREEYQPTNISREAADSVYRSQFELTLVAVSYDQDEKTGAVFPSGQEYANSLSRSKESQIARGAFHSLYANISAPTLGNKYRIRELEMSPEYHVVIKVDPQKDYPPGEVARPPREILEQLPDWVFIDDAKIEATIEEIRRKQQRHKEFLRDLGPDPRLEAARSSDGAN